MEAWESGLTTNILYDCDGVDADSGRRFHCWITNRTIPLDEICRNDIAIKSRCSVAAFLCLLRAARHGLYLSDCHFFNFGVLLTESATKHLVVIIDAGSSGIHRDKLWKKSKINIEVMQKFWKACAEESATNVEIEDMWRHRNSETHRGLPCSSDNGMAVLAVLDQVSRKHWRNLACDDCERLFPEIRSPWQKCTQNYGTRRAVHCRRSMECCMCFGMLQSI